MPVANLFLLSLFHADAGMAVIEFLTTNQGESTYSASERNENISELRDGMDRLIYQTQEQQIVVQHALTLSLQSRERLESLVS